ncbi:hypothetical protein [Gemmata sp.]|uniref:hypothetical protein n=1 Tax=Gemmata sp. TaxID=1914242 RepID=UPI003F7186B4
MRTTNTPPAARCPCGNDDTHPAALPVKRRSVLGAMALLMGYTARPARIDWVCPTCGAVLDSVTDPAALERARYDEPRRAAR